jgi:predicted RNA-binding protein with TRAM domain
MSYGQNTRTTSGFSKPVETGKEYTVDTTDTGRSGDGIARIGGFIIFVKHTLINSNSSNSELISLLKME